jgi:hypothetical protein
MGWSPAGSGQVPRLESRRCQATFESVPICDTGSVPPVLVDNRSVPPVIVSARIAPTLSSRPPAAPPQEPHAKAWAGRRSPVPKHPAPRFRSVWFWSQQSPCLRRRFPDRDALTPEPVALAFDIHDDAVVEQSVQQGRDDDRILEQLGPLVEPLVAGDHQAGLFVTP